MKKCVLLFLLLIASVTQATAFEFCDDGTTGEDNLRIISVDDMLKNNNNEWEWEAPQEIELEIRIQNKEDETKEYTLEAIFIENDDEAEIVENDDDLETTFQLNGNSRESISLNFEIDKDTEIGNYELYVKLYEKGNEDDKCTENSEEEITIEKIELCEDGNIDEDDLEIKKIIDEKRNNDNEWEWISGSEVDLSVELSNKEYSERDFTVELIMLNEDNEEIEFSEDETRIEKTISIDEDEEETIYFNFELDQNLEEGEYSLYAKIYDEENTDVCTTLKAEGSSSSKKVKIEREDNNVIITEVSGPKDIQTNTETSYAAKITNVGNEDEEKVMIILLNRKLGIKEQIEIEDLESGAETEMTFSFSVPENATLGKQTLTFITEFEYDSKKNRYKKYSKKEDEVRYYVNITKGITVEDIIENETIGNETVENETVFNETIEDTFFEDEAPEESAPITGNVVGISERKSIWPMAIGFLLLAGIGIFFFLKKPKAKKHHQTENPVANRRYTARLD